MRILASFFLFALAIHSSSLLAAKQGLDPDAQATTLKLSQAKNWKQLLAETRDLLPGNVVKEMETAAKGLDYPDVRLHRGEMILSEPNGGRLNILLDKEGKVFFNGEEWEIRPLATTQAEVDRIVAFIFDSRAKKRRRSMLEIVLPFAHADDGSSSASGMALAAQMKAMIHKARACGGENLTEAQERECALMAVGVREASAQPAETEEEKKKFLPVNLTCPESVNNGTLILLRKNRLGQGQRTKIKYISGKATVVTVSAALNGSDFQDLKAVDLRKPNSPEVLSFIKKVTTQINAVKAEGCDGNEGSRRSYLAKLEANRDSLANVQNVNHVPEEQGGVNGAI